MKTQTQTNADRAHIAKLIDDIPIAMLATVESDGALASRPMAALEMDASGALWFFTDTAHGTYVSLSGRGEIDTDRTRIERLWTAFAKPWFPEGPGSPNLALLKFIPEAADYWDAPNSKMIRAFGAIASMVAGKPIAMGEHGSHTGLSSGASSA